MTVLPWLLFFSLLGAILSVVAAASYLLLPERRRQQLLPHMVSFAIGTLLGAAFLALIPHALESPHVQDMHSITATILIGLLTFFVLEKLVLWRHCHAFECEVHGADDHHHAAPETAPAGTLVLIGDAVHNFVDGVLIAAAFLTDFHLGVVTAIAVAAHEIPQEVGDFAILLQSGFSRGKAFLYNILASLATVIGALIAYFSLQTIEQYIPFVLAVAASSFIYVAVADLIPGLHKRTEAIESVKQIALIASGILVVYTAHLQLH